MLLDFLFPKTCVGCGKRGTYFCPACVLQFPLTRLICPMCGKGSIGGITHAHCRRALGIDGLRSVFPYKGGVQDAIKRLKYRFVREVGAALIEAVTVRTEKGVLDFFIRERFSVVPVPLHKVRERWRGFNQAALLGEILSKHWGLEYQDLLLRTKNTDALAELRARVTSKEREKLKQKYASTTQQRMAERDLLKNKKTKMRRDQMRGAFRLRDQSSPKSFATGQADVRDQKFILVDDVWTSGATMLACCKVLKRSGSSEVWGFTFARSGW